MRTLSKGAAPRLAVSSGDGGTIALRRRVVGDRLIVGREADGLRRSRPNDLGHRGRQGAHARHAAAQSAARLVMVQRQCFGIGCRSSSLPVLGRRNDGRRRMVARAAVCMDVLGDRTGMLVHDGHAVCVLGEARRSAGAVPEGERHRRPQNAEQIHQREQSPCRRSPGPGKPAQHRSFGVLAAQWADIRKPRRKARPRQVFAIFPKMFPAWRAIPIAQRVLFLKTFSVVKAGDPKANRSALLRAERRQEDADYLDRRLPVCSWPGRPPLLLELPVLCESRAPPDPCESPLVLLDPEAVSDAAPVELAAPVPGATAGAGCRSRSAARTAAATALRHGHRRQSNEKRSGKNSQSFPGHLFQG